MYLTNGTYTISASNSAMNVQPISVTTENETNRVEVVATPDNVSVTFRIFLDTNDDLSWENGTAVSPTFNITSINDFGIDVEVTEDMYDANTGELTVDLSVGAYIITLIEDDPRDENASDFRKFASGSSIS